MGEEAQFRSNCEKWARIHRDQAKSLLEMAPQQVVLQQNAKGMANLKRVVDGQERFYHSQENPEEEALRWFSDLALSDIQVLFIYGVGLGYVYDCAKNWLRADKTRSLIFMEDDLEVIYHLFNTPRGSEILNDKQVWLAFLDPAGSALNWLAASLVSKSFKIKELQIYGQIHKERYKQLKAKLSSYMTLSRFSEQDYSDFGRSIFSNLYRNIPLLPEARLATPLFGQFAGIPAIICGSGPSLAKNLSLLTTLSDRALILAGGTAINAVNTAGLLPHFGVGSAPHPAQYPHLLMNQAFNIPYFYRNRFLNEGLKLEHGQPLYIPGADGYRISRWFDEKLGIKPLVEFKEGYTEQNYSLALACALGCNPIILVGMDLAYTNDKSTIGGIFNHPLHHRSEYSGSQSTEEPPLVKLDISGKPIYTSWKWLAESFWMSNFVKLHGNKRFVNATEGGMVVLGIPNRTLKEVVDLYLEKSYDIEGMVHQQIEAAKNTSHISVEQIEPLIRTLMQSLDRCEKACRIIQQDCEETERAFKEGGEAPPLSEKGLRAFEKIAEEPAYEQLLQPYSRIYSQSHRQESNQSIYEAFPKGFQEVEIKKAQLNQARYAFLSEAANAHKNILNEVLQKPLKAQVVGSKLPVKYPSEAADYHFEKGIIQITDTEIGLEIREPFQPDPNSIRRQYSPSGQLISEQFYQKGLLHGPSTYFNYKGTLLSHQWFIRGKKQGKAFTYTSEGKICSIHRWRDGVLEGNQETFYPDGTCKSHLQYKEGKLHGDVQLFYPSGKPKRELHFDAGKRQGFERIWNEEGQLILEAEFDQDKPKGLARQWYANGQLAFEIAYDEEAERAQIQEWDSSGSPSLVEKRMIGDYFDQVALQTTKLTNTLSEVMDQVDTLAPLVETFVSDTYTAKSNEKEIETIKREIENLKRISRDLIKESEEEERVWKGASAKQAVEQQVQDMAQQISKEMGTIQNSLAVTLGALAKKLKRKEEKTGEEDLKKDG